MSKITEIKTNKSISAMDICKRLAEFDGYGIAIKDEVPTAKIYIPGVSIRETEISIEDYGYEVRLTVLACEEDYKLYRDTVKHIVEMTNGKAIYEDEYEIENAVNFFNNDFINERLNDEFEMTVSFIKNNHEICLVCPFRQFYIGKKVLEKLEKHSSEKALQRAYLFEMIRKSQYDYKGEADTPVFVIEKNEEAKNEKVNKTLTIYRHNEYGFISSADYFSLINADEEYVVISYTDLHGIVPKSWYLFDEKQHVATSISKHEWNEFWNNAKKYETKL
jgi:hypothetical protein